MKSSVCSLLETAEPGGGFKGPERVEGRKRRFIQVKFPDRNLDNKWFAAGTDTTQNPPDDVC